MNHFWQPLRYEERCKRRAMLLDAAAAELVDVARNVGGVKAVYAYGSYARGSIRPESDLDALIVRETDLPRFERETDVRRALRSTCGFDLLVVTPEEYATELSSNVVGRSIIAEAKLLYAI